MKLFVVVLVAVYIWIWLFQVQSNTEESAGATSREDSKVTQENSNWNLSFLIYVSTIYDVRRTIVALLALSIFSSNCPTYAASFQKTATCCFRIYLLLIMVKPMVYVRYCAPGEVGKQKYRIKKYINRIT